MSLRPYAASLVLLLAAFVRADDANWSTFGGAGAFIPNRHVRMEREKVRIVLDDRTVRVHATFWFRNRGLATTVRMGFPDETAEQGASTKPPIKRFRSTVDGRPVRVAHERLKPGFDKSSELTVYRSAWVKTVPFARDGARRVEVWYEASRGSVISGTVDTYVFKTGATWRGNIGRIDTTVDWSAARKTSRPALRLTGLAPGARWTRLGPRRTRLVVENVEPRFDLDLGSVDGFWNFRLNGRTLSSATASDDSGPVIEGPPADIRISVAGLGTLFDERYRPGATGVGDAVWHAPEARGFGGKLTLLGTQTLVTGKGRRLRLSRPATDARGKPLEKDDPPYVRLRDVFAALGGTYRFVPREERVELTLPKGSGVVILPATLGRSIPVRATVRATALDHGPDTLCIPVSQGGRPPRWLPTPQWTGTLRRAGTPLTVKIRKASGSVAEPNPYPPTRVEIWNGVDCLASGTTDLFFEPSQRPYLRGAGRAAILAFAANPGAGSGPFASLWRIGDRRQLQHLGDLRRADLRDLSQRGIVREFREAKYATPDILSRFPQRLNIGRSYVVEYRLDRKAERLELRSVRLSHNPEAWPWTIRFPAIQSR